MLKWRGAIVFTGFAFLLTVCSPLAAGAEDKDWIGGSGQWNIESNWSSPGQPGDGDNIFLVSDPGTTVTYQNEISPAPALNQLTIESNIDGGAPATLLQEQDELKTFQEYIGFHQDRSGTFRQTGGAHTVDYQILLGLEFDAVGTYEMSGDEATRLEADHLTLGHQGIGIFNQTGGAAALSTLTDLPSMNTSGTPDQALFPRPAAPTT